MTTEPDYRTEPDLGIDIIERDGKWAVREKDQYHCVDAPDEMIHRIFEIEEEAKRWAQQLKLYRITGYLAGAEVIMDEALDRTDEGETNVIISQHYFYQVRGAITDAVRFLDKLCEIKHDFEDDLQ